MLRREFLGRGAAFALSAARPVGAGSVSSTNGLLDVTLDASQNTVRLAGRQARLYTYNGSALAPRLEACPGDLVRIRLVNRLPEATNLHFHGLHVSPESPADNSMLRVAAGSSFLYQFRIPSDHPAGTFWYHPHVHGAAARQVWRGLAGLFVVRGALDAVPEIAAMSEHFLVLQDRTLDSYGNVVEPMMMNRMWGREGSPLTVNGQLRPTLGIQSGGAARMHFLNASPSRFYRLAVENHTMHVLATEGGALPQPLAVQEYLLVPGARVQVAVLGTGAGKHRILSLPYDRGANSPATMELGYLEYAGSAASVATLPAKLVPVAALVNPSTVRSFVLSMGGMAGMQMRMGMGMSATINGLAYDRNRIDERVKLGAIEDWDFINNSRMDHPMHVHTNPVQVVGEQPAWRDTVNVPAWGRVRVRIQFRDFTGMSMYHCHILDHEDMGMMGNLLIEG